MWVMPGKAKKPICSELDKLLENTKNIKPKRNLTAEEMDELNENLFSGIQQPVGEFHHL